MPDEKGDLYRKAVNRFNELHSSIFGAISSMLVQAKLQPMASLRGKDPSFIELVKELQFYRDVAENIAELLEIDHDEQLAMIDEYLGLAKAMADAIESDSHDALCGAIAALDEKPYI